MNKDIINFLNNIDFENSVMVYETVVNLLEEKQKYKEVIDKAINYINAINGGTICTEFDSYLAALLDILKEVE